MDVEDAAGVSTPSGGRVLWLLIGFFWYAHGLYRMVSLDPAPSLFFLLVGVVCVLRAIEAPDRTLLGSLGGRST